MGRLDQRSDIHEDRAEEHNIAADHPDIVERMKTTLADWRRSCAASKDGADYAE